MSINSPKICRICMISDESTELLSIFEPHNNMVGESVSILEKLSSINIQIIKHDCLPEDICKICMSELNAAIKFREKSQNSERILRNVYLGSNFSEHLFDDYDIKTNCNQTITVKLDENLPLLPHECMIKIEELDEVVDAHYLKTENLVPEPESAEKKKNPLTFEDNVLICKICGKTFGQVRLLNRHIARHLKAGNKSLRNNKTKLNLTGPSCLEDNKLICKTCDKTFGHARYLKRHIERHLKAGNKPLRSSKKTLNLTRASITIPKTENNATFTYECNKCGMCFNSQNILTSHTNKHSQHDNAAKNTIELDGVKLSSFFCAHCNREFRQKRHLRRHILRIHIDSKAKSRPFYCEMCTGAFVDEKQLAAHKFKQHDNNSCPICYKNLKHFSSLKDHIAAVHEQLRNFLCSLCGKSFPSTSGLRAHIKSHSVQSKEYICDICSKVFRCKGTVKKHIKATHLGIRPYACNVLNCNAKFSRGSSLKLHHQVHTGERRFKCDYCAMRFRDSGHRLRHHRTHTGEKPYKCPYDDCEKAFAQKGDLHLHKRIHTGEKPHICHCGAAFRQPSTLKTHMKVHQKGEKTV